MCGKCNDGLQMRFGDYDVDLCLYEDIQKIANVTVTVSRCTKCGHIMITWERQENSIELPLEGEDYES